MFSYPDSGPHSSWDPRGEEKGSTATVGSTSKGNANYRPEYLSLHSKRSVSNFEALGKANSLNVKSSMRKGLPARVNLRMT
jgi:hypothetical protein